MSESTECRSRLGGAGHGGGSVKPNSLPPCPARPPVGCGGGKDDSASGRDKRAKTEEAALAWAECMRENGVDVPDPKVDANGRLVIEPGNSPPERPDESFRRASEKCDEFMRDALASQDEISKEEQARMRDAALAFTKCMRERGIDLPDPDTRGGGVSVQVDPDDPAFQRAAEACDDKLPLPGGGS